MRVSVIPGLRDFNLIKAKEINHEKHEKTRKKYHEVNMK